MLSSISSYIWGGEAETSGPTEVAAPPAVPNPALRDPSPSDWVLVGNQPGPGSLSGLEPLNTPAASEAPSEVGDETSSVQATNPAAAQQRTAVRPANQEASVSLKHLKSAQMSRQKNSGKALSSKALKRGNKAVVPHKTREVAKYNMSIKSAGLNKNLKQC